MRIIASLVTLALVSATPVLADVRSLTVEKGNGVEASRSSNWAEDCTPGWVKIEVVNKPRFGLLTQKQVKTIIGDFGRGRLTGGEIGPCYGEPITATQLFYTPNPTYAGPDAFTVRMSYEFIDTIEHTYVVQVK